MRKIRLVPQGVFGILFAFLLASAACSNEEDSLPTSEGAATNVQLTFNGLEPLESGFSYQAWVISYVYAFPLGVFNIDQDGDIVNMSGDTLLSGEFTINLKLEDISGVIICIEPQDAMVASPSYTLILGGTVSEGQAALTVEDNLGIGISFDGASGKYILATPTDSIDTNENSGIWFLDMTTGVSLNGFVLPEIPAGWDYEGWVILDGTYISTGKFSRFTTADDSAYYSGPVAGPPFPGEDFLQNAPEGLSFPVDLTGASVMITVEPWYEYDDNQEEPFFIKILVADIPPDVTDHVTYDLSAGTDPLPAGTATLTSLD